MDPRLPMLSVHYLQFYMFDEFLERGIPRKYEGYSDSHTSSMIVPSVKYKAVVCELAGVVCRHDPIRPVASPCCRRVMT